MYVKDDRAPQRRWWVVNRTESLPATNPPSLRVTLMADDEHLVSVPEDDFLAHYQAEPGGAAPNTAEVVKETLANIRAHSTIRFVALPFMLGALAVLVNALAHSPSLKREVILAGLLLFACGAVFEIVLSRNLIVWWQALGTTVRGAAGWAPVGAHRAGGALWAARVALFVPYPAALAYWVYQWLRNLSSFSPWHADLTRWPAFVAAVAAGLAVTGAAAAVWTGAKAAGEAGAARRKAVWP
jgi:hypothetical protein